MRHMIHLHLSTRAIAPQQLAFRVVYQRPHLPVPFTASNGVEIRELPSGRPFVGYIGETLVIGVRGDTTCPATYRSQAVVSRLPDADTVERQVKQALREYRRSLNT